MVGYSSRLIINKMSPLRRTVSLIERSELISRLGQHRKSLLTVVHAPAGYGKTTLLTQYYDHLAANREHCGWLTLDGSDDDPVQLLAYLIASLESTDLVSKDVMDAAFNGLHGLNEKSAINLISNVLSGIQESVTLFLDDYHTLSADNTELLFQRLIELTSGNTRFIVASREIPVNLKGRLQLTGSYYELTASDLSFTRLETGQLVASSSGINASEEYAELLHEKTEGWVAAIEFAKTWLDKNTDFHVSDFINQSTDFATFLITEIYRCLPSDMQDTMVKTSIVNEFDGDLINAICERNDGWQILDELTQRDLVIPVDETRNSFRYHHLITEFLLDRFQKQGANDAKKLHSLAAGWYLDQDNPSEALRHALAHKDPELIASILERAGGWRLMLDGRISTFASMIGQLDQVTLERFPSTYLGYLLLTAKSEFIAQASAKFDLFRSKTSDFSTLNGVSLPPSFAIEANVVDFFLGALEDKPQTPQHIAVMESVLRDIKNDDHFLQALLLNFLTYSYFDNGSLDKALKAGETAISHYKELRSIYGENYLYFHLGKIFLAQGRLRDAQQFYDEGYQLAIANFGTDSDIAAIAAAHLAEVAYEVNDIRQAQEWLEIALPRIEQSEAWFDVYISAYLTAARIAYISADATSATRIIRKASRTGKRRNIYRLRIFSLCQHVRFLIDDGRMRRASWIIDGLKSRTMIDGAISSDFVSHRLKEQVGSTVAYFLIVDGRSAEAIKIVEPLLATAKRFNGGRSLISLSLLLTLAYFRLNKLKRAYARLNDAMSHAIFEEFRRPFLEYGDDMLELLEAAPTHTKLFPMNRLKRAFIADLIALIKRRNRTINAGAPSSLTRREREIVRHIRDGCTNKEIARNCNCTENTVKFHLKNVFAKLDVSSRKALAQRAWHENL